LSKNVKIKTETKAKTREKTKTRIKIANGPIIPVTRNCSSCAANDDVMGCRLSGKLSPSKCVFNGFSYYKKGKKFFFCERCETHSVTSQIVGFVNIPYEPRIVFWCQNCDDYPIVEGEEYQGYSIEGITFVNKSRINSHLDRKDGKGEIFR